MRKSSLAVAILLLAGTLVGVAILPQNARAATLYVGGGGPGNYTTIQAAIDAAFPGDSVFVFNGTYFETLIVNKTISLVGEDTSTTIIDTMGGGTAIRITSDWVNVTGFTIMNSGSLGGFGVELQTVNDCYIANNSVKPDFTHGITLSSTSGNIVVNNTVSTRRYGITLEPSANDRILNNTVLDSMWGIDLRRSSTSIVKGNTMIGNSIFLLSSFLSELNTHTIDTSNTVNGKPVYYWKNVSGGIVPSGAGEVILANCTDVTVENQNVSGGTVGIHVAYSSNITVTNNTGSDGMYGIHVSLTDRSTFSHNNVSHNMYDGIHLEFSQGNVIHNNTAIDNDRGFGFWVSSRSTTVDNTASNNAYGFYVLESEESTFTFNNATMNGGSGFHLSSANRISIVNCNISRNAYVGISLASSENNTIENDNVSDSSNYGILFYRSRNNIVSNNTVRGNLQEGIQLWESNDNTIADNNISDSVTGVNVTLSNGNAIRRNSVLSNSIGVYINRSSYGTVRANAVSDGTWCVLAQHSGTIDIMNNTLNCIVYGVFGKNLTDVIIRDNAALNNTIAMDLSDSRNITIHKNNVSGLLTGIELFNVNESAVSNNTSFHNSWEGIRVGISSNVTIEGNVVSESRRGIWVDQSTRITVTGNTLARTGVAVWGRSLQHWNTHAIETSNAVNGKPAYYWKDTVGGTIPFGAGQVILANCSGVEVRNQNVSNTSAGIQVGFSSRISIHNSTALDSHVDSISLFTSDNNTVNDNVMSSNRTFGFGVYIDYSNNNLVANNTMKTNWFGILVDYSEGNDIRKNDVSDSEHGIHLSDSNYNTISGNEVHNSDDGIHLHYAFNNTIESNRAHNNRLGIYIRQSDDNVVKRNNVSANTLGIGGHISYGNRIYHNWLVGNTIQGSDSGDANQWDDGYPSGGNYWSDYGGVDLMWGPNQNLTGSDGIGDTPYVIDADSQDRYPLMNPPSQPRTFTRLLPKGLNLVSFPLTPLDESAEAVLQTVKFDKAWTYDPLNQKWIWYMDFKTYKGDLTSVNNTIGIWINVTEESNLTVAGVIPTDTTIQLRQGWNLIGFPSFNTTYTVADLKVETGATRVEGFDPSAPPYFLRVLADGDALQAGYGYWVHVETATTWVVST